MNMCLLRRGVGFGPGQIEAVIGALHGPELAQPQDRHRRCRKPGLDWPRERRCFAGTRTRTDSTRGHQ